MNPAQSLAASLNQSTSGVTHNFYFASTKKGGALGNFPVQIAKIHENLLQLIAKISESKEAAAGVEKPKSQTPNVSFDQFKTLSGSALRSISRLIKLELFQYATFCEPASRITYNGAEFLQQTISKLRLKQQMFSVCYYQALVHLQQYANSCNHHLFVPSIPSSGSATGANAGEAAKKSGTTSTPSIEKDRRRRYLTSCISETVAALRFLVEQQKSMVDVTAYHGEGARRQVELMLACPTLNQWSDRGFWGLAQMTLE